ncbi:aminotransferase class III-fold pyridoxal phosphate-dependent enzyme [Duganella sp. PWIR1]
MTIPLITRARNDLLWTDSGHELIDLFSAYGTNWLGHCRPEVVAAMSARVTEPWSLGGLRHAAGASAEAALQPFCAPHLRSAGLYSTGMEVAEFAMRIARAHTGRNGLIGFARSMHGKSTATAGLSWDNADGLVLPHLHRLPFVDTHAEDAILAEVEQRLRDGTVGAVYLEVLQGSNGGWEASSAFYAGLALLVQRYGALLICDEILTGFYRTGPCFRFEAHGLVPDIVLFGKACGNGFPVAGLFVRTDIAITPKMLQGSTFSGNPLACVAVESTLGVLGTLDCKAMVAAIAERFEAHLGWLRGRRDVVLRGCGALWFVELPDAGMAAEIVRQSYQRGVCIGYYGRFLRLLPAMTIDTANLDRACSVLAAVLEQELTGHG